jgi:hypothetical protein
VAVRQQAKSQTIISQAKRVLWGLKPSPPSSLLLTELVISQQVVKTMQQPAPYCMRCTNRAVAL